MTRIRHIVFDIGKVLLHYDPEIPFRRLIPDAGRREWFFAHVCTHDWNLEQDRGRSWQEAEALLIAAFPQEEDNIRAFRRHWNEMVPHAHADSVAIMEGLIDAGRDITMLTNFAPDTYEEVRRRFRFLDRPRGVTVSGKVGLVKPDRAIYDHHAGAFDLDPPATLFIDDSPRNVEGARAAGWQAVVFRDAEKLRTDLQEFGAAV